MTYNDIFFFGDSILRGTVNDNGRLKSRENKDYPFLEEKGFTVHNLSTIGATVERGQKTIDRNIDKIDSSTIVVMNYGGNDSDFDWKIVSEHPNEENSPHVPLDKFISSYTKIINDFKELGSKVAICNLIPIDAEKYFKWIGQLGKPENILKWLGDTEMLYRWHETYNRAIETIVQLTSCALIDVRSAFLTRHDFESLLGIDGIHPTEKGYHILDSTISGALVY